MIEYALLPTSICTNDCMICGTQGELRYPFYHIGQTEKEIEGIENLLLSMEGSFLDLSCNDPLRNEVVLDLVPRFHPKGQNGLVFNPITFLSLALGKKASKIKGREVDALFRRTSKIGLSENVKSLVSKFSKFDQSRMSCGTLQAPYPKVMNWAVNFFEHFILPELKYLCNGKLNYQGDSFNHITFGNKLIFSAGISGDKKGNLRHGSYFPRCVGRLRDNVISGKVRGQKGINKQDKLKNCEVDNNYLLYFEKVKESAYLCFASCCSLGFSNYAGFRTSITLEDMASMSSRQISQAIGEENQRREETALFNLLNDRSFDWLAYKLGEGRCPTDEKFDNYIRFAEELIRAVDGRSVRILDEVYTAYGHPNSCDVCYTTSLMLKRAGISPQEWQDYLEKEVKN